MNRILATETHIVMSIYRLIILQLLLLTCTAVDGQTRIELSLDEALAVFYQRNLDLMAARYNIDQARADELVAAAIPNPVLGVQVAEISRNPNMGSLARGCNPDPQVSCGPAEIFSFSQLIEMAGKRGLRMEASTFATQAAESDFRDAVRIFSNLVRDSYYEALLMQKNRALAEELAQHYRQIVEVNRLRLQAGDIAEADYLKVKMESSRAESELDTAVAAEEQAHAKLLMVLRWPDQNAQLQVKEQWPVVQDWAQQPAAEFLIGKALQQRPDLLADRQRAEQADKALELARRLKYPDVTVNAGYARDPSNNALDSFFVGVNVPVPLFYQYQGESDKAAVSLNQNRMLAEQTELAIRNEVVGALAVWRSTDKILQRFKRGLLDEATTVRHSAELSYGRGATSVLDLIEAERSYKNIMRDYFAALINHANAYYDLGKSLGNEVYADSAPLNPAAPAELP